MVIKKLKVRNFKSIYGEHEFDFSDFTGITKLSGRVGTGKTTLCEAILYALYGSVKNRKIQSLISWNEREMEASIELVSRGKALIIKRGTAKQTELMVDGRAVPAPSKRDMQDVINMYYDAPRMFVERMCVISFDASKMSLINMTPAETKQFMDDVLGFGLFTEYADLSNRNMLDAKKEADTLSTAIRVTNGNIERTESLLKNRLSVLNSNFDEEAITEAISYMQNDINIYNKKIKETDEAINNVSNEYKLRIDKMSAELLTLYDAKKDAEIHGKAARKKYDAMNTGVCPVCGSAIDAAHIAEVRAAIDKNAEEWRAANAEYKKVNGQLENLKTAADNEIAVMRAEKRAVEEKMKLAHTDMASLKSKIISHTNILKETSANYDEMLRAQRDELVKLNGAISGKEREQNEWAELTETISSTLRYKLLGQIVPYINTSIQNYLSNMGAPFYMAYDESFKPHLYSYFFNKEIQYASLSTGQKKTVDMAAIFGVLDTVMSMYDFNVIVLDELFSNMDANMRNSIIQIMRHTIAKDRSVFIVSHSDIDDSYFDHKLRAELHGDTANNRKGSVCIMKSVYNKIF